MVILVFEARSDSALYRLFVVTLWLTFINGITFMPDPNPLVAGEANYSLTFTRETGDPQDLEATFVGKGLLTMTFPIRFQNQSQIFYPADSNLAFEQGCVFIDR